MRDSTGRQTWGRRTFGFLRSARSRVSNSVRIWTWTYSSLWLPKLLSQHASKTKGGYCCCHPPMLLILVPRSNLKSRF